MENLLITPVVHWKNKQTNKEKTIQNLKWSTALCLGLLSDCSYNRSLGSEQPQKPASFRRSPSDWVCLVRRPHSKSVASAAEVLVVSAPQPPQWCRSLRGQCRHCRAAADRRVKHHSSHTSSKQQQPRVFEAVARLSRYHLLTYGVGLWSFKMPNSQNAF